MLILTRVHCSNKKGLYPKRYKPFLFSYVVLELPEDNPMVSKSTSCTCSFVGLCRMR